MQKLQGNTNRNDGVKHYSSSTRRIIGFVIGLIVFTFNALPAFAQMPQIRAENREPGWQLSAGIGLMYFKTTGLTQEKIDSYDDQTESKTKLMPWPSFQIRYNDKDESGNWYFGMKRGGLTVERQQKIGFGKINVEVGIDLFGYLDIELPGKDFKNPYLLGENRDTTSNEQRAYAVNYSIGKDPGFSLGYRREDWQMGEDMTPEIHPSLGRDGYKETFSTGIRFRMLRLGYSLFSTTTDGDADSNSGYKRSISVGLPLFSKGLKANIIYGDGKAEYDAVHPVFQKVREDETMTVSLMMLLRDEDRQWRMMVSQKSSDSNIDFFDTAKLFASFGVTWQF